MAVRANNGIAPVAIVQKRVRGSRAIPKHGNGSTIRSDSNVSEVDRKIASNPTTFAYEKRKRTISSWKLRSLHSSFFVARVR